MPQRANLQVGLLEDGDLSGQIHRRVRQAIIDGLLEAGQALPSTRELAAQLAVSRTTVGTAYDRLMAEGLVHGRPGVGTFVQARPTGRPVVRTSPLRPAELWSTLSAATEGTPVVASSSAFDLRPALPDRRLFPFATWRTLVSRHTNATALLDRSHTSAAGHVRLRESLAKHLGVFRAVHANPDDVFVTSGAQQAMELAVRVLVEPGDAVAVGEPGDRDVHTSLTSLGLQVVPVPVDADGLVVDAIPDGVRGVHVRSARNFPFGMPLSGERRQRLLSWAHRVDGVILDEDYDCEFQHAGRPVGLLHGLDESGRVLHVGSLDRLTLPELRIGYLVAPPPLHAALLRAKQVIDPHPSTPEHLAMADFMGEGHLARHIRRMRSVYAERRQLLVGAVTQALSEHLKLLPSTAGLDVAAVFHRTGLDDALVSRRAGESEVSVTALSDVATSGQRGLILGFGALSTEHVDEGVARLLASIESVAGHAG